MLKFPADLKNPKAIVVMLHGYGASADQWINLAPHIQHPDILYVAPHGFNKMEWGGYQWFELVEDNELKMSLLPAGVEHVRPLVIAMIDKLAAEYNVPHANIILMGFSQGAMIALDVVTHHKEMKYAVGVSGMLVKTVSDDRIFGDKNILLIHGTEDTIVPYHFAVEAEKELIEQGMDVILETRPGLGHSIDGEGLKAIREFLNVDLP